MPSMLLVLFLFYFLKNTVFELFDETTKVITLKINQRKTKECYYLGSAAAKPNHVSRHGHKSRIDVFFKSLRQHL